MGNFYLVCGICGGGKTVLSNRIASKHQELVVLDVDAYYEKVNGDECIRKNFFEVWHMLFQDIHDLEISGKDVLLSTNALTVCQRSQFVEWFPTFVHHLIWVTAPWERCVEGNKSRRRHVPDDVMKQQWDEMEFPTAQEKGWDTISQVTNCWDHENYIIYNLKGRIDKVIAF